ncbi:hypothetical protein ABIB48_000819 [Arthrobacter sp. UYCu511]|uniref:hypothetical protein n=1 Tax=Arthrobacter sp. UYCu511 TaxID=3156337 RepID=UPI003392AC7B
MNTGLMDTGPLGFEQQPSFRSRPPMCAGYTNISSGTLDQLIAAIAADAFKVPLQEVRASLHDEQGQVGVRLVVPLMVRAAKENSTAVFSTLDGGTVFEWAAAARKVVAARFALLAGSTVARVDVRFTGIHEAMSRTAGRVQ